MKARKCWRYTCDFCKKSGCSKNAIADHEARCFCNPARKCPMCEDDQGPLVDLMALFEGADQGTVDSFVEKVETAAHGCPACTISAIRQSEHLETEHDVLGYDGEPIAQRRGRLWVNYDYKTKADAYMNDKRSEETALYL